jgi:hypothetical protein
MLTDAELDLDGVINALERWDPTRCQYVVAEVISNLACQE